MVDCFVGLILYGHVALIEILGDLLLFEIAVLFVLAGILDISYSLGTVQFRKALSSSKESFSIERRKIMEKQALAFVASGVTLMCILVAFAIVFKR